MLSTYVILILALRILFAGEFPLIFTCSVDAPPWGIIGGAVGAVAVVIIIIILVACWVHKKRKCRKDTKGKYEVSFVTMLPSPRDSYYYLGVAQIE